MDPTDFTVGWICALPIELAAALGMLEEVYDEKGLQKNPPDTNQYRLGKIAGHKIVLTCLTSAGTNGAGLAASHMAHTFQNVKTFLMVGIGGGIPGSSSGQDVRLGDVVVSMPSGDYGGVIQYDIGKFLAEGFQRTGPSQGPSRNLQRVVKMLMADHERQENCIARYIDEMLENTPYYTRSDTNYRRPARENDLLFEANSMHVGKVSTCADCHKEQLVARHERDEDKSKIHYGNIVSGNGVVRDAKKRDDLGRKYGALCIEMEAGGLVGEFECLVIRGICDYSDSHKNKDWQRYAAAAAAAYTKELLHCNEPLNMSRNNSEPSNSREIANTKPPTEIDLFLPSQAATGSPPLGVPPVKSSPTNPSSPATFSAGPSHIPQRSPDDLQPLYQRPPTQPIQPSSRHSSLDKPTSSVPPPQVRSAGHAWEAKTDEYILVDVPSDQYESYRPETQDSNPISQCDLRLFEMVNSRYGIPTRRLAIRSREHEDQCVSYWMPLDNVLVEVEDRQLTISWSDCSHIRKEVKSYQTTFSYQYIPENRNRILIAHFEDAAVVQKLADALLFPTLEKSHYERNGVPAGPSSSNALSVYKHRPSAMSNKSCVDQHTEFAILVSSAAVNYPRSSKLFFGQPTLDFWQDEVREQFIFRNMRCLVYTSILEKPAPKDLARHVDPEGGPDGWEWQSEDLALSLKDFNLKDFLMLLTGWQLLFNEVASDVILKSGGMPWQSKKMKDAWVTIWERDTKTGKGLQLLIRTSNANGEPNDSPWLSVPLTSAPVELTSPDVTTIEMKDQACLRGTEILIYQMSVDTSQAPEVKKIRLQFNKSNHRDRFRDAIEFLNPPLRRTTITGDKPSIRQLESITSLPR